MSHYRRGADFERRAKARLEQQGYVVFRSAGSKSPVDLLAFGHRRIMFVQCKCGARNISGRERAELIDLAEDCGAIAVVCTRGLLFEVLSGEERLAA